MEAPYPGIGREIRDDKFMNWPNEKWSRGSYYFPRVNEVTKWGPFWKAGHRGRLQFAGEHTCYAFMGYVEGALSSGYRIARRIAVRDELPCMIKVRRTMNMSSASRQPLRTCLCGLPCYYSCYYFRSIWPLPEPA